jgi:hypothetical protein
MAPPQPGQLEPGTTTLFAGFRVVKGLGVVGVDLVVEGEGRATTAGAVAQGGGLGCPLPLESVADDRGVADRRPGALDKRCG